MKIQLSFIYLTLKLIFYLSTEVNGRDDSHLIEARQRIHERAVLRPTASEISIAVSDSKVVEDIQVEKMQHFFYVGQYPVDFIQMLNTCNTLSDDPIKLSSDEITTLTSKYDGGSKNNRIITQFKFYQKVQEIQCKNYVHLMYILPKFEVPWEVISNYVSNMIKLSYRGKFVVSAWLWELHIKLLGLENKTLDTQQFLKKHIPEINCTLQKLITSCLKNKYLRKENDYTSRLPTDTFLEMYDEKYVGSFEKHTMPIDVEHLLTKSIKWPKWELYYDICGIDFNWNHSNDIIQTIIENIKDQYDLGGWTTEPFKYITYHKIILDILIAKLYSYIWVHLVIYQKIVTSTLPPRTLRSMFAEMFNTLWNTSNNNVTDRSKLRREYDYFLFNISYTLHFAYIDDKILDEVLILLSEIYEPDDEMIDKTINILEDAVNHIMRHYSEPGKTYQEATIDYVCIKRKYNDNIDFLFRNNIQVGQFFHGTAEKLGLNLNDILFYINGSKTPDFVFPNII